METRVVTRNSTASIYRGPLLYALGIECAETKQTPLDYRDGSELTSEKLIPGSTYDFGLKPTSPWKYAIDPESVQAEDHTHDIPALPNPIFSMDAAPTFVTVEAYPIEWPEERGTAADPPQNPAVDLSTRTRIRLVPFGSAQLHIAEFPIAAR